MGLAGRIHKGKVHFVKEMPEVLNKINDAAILCNQIDLELKAFKSEVDDMVNDTHFVIVKDKAIDAKKMGEMLKKWPDFIKTALKGFDSDSEVRNELLKLKESWAGLKTSFEKDAIAADAHRDWLKKIGMTGLHLIDIVDKAIKDSDIIAQMELNVGKHTREDLKRLI